MATVLGGKLSGLRGSTVSRRGHFQRSPTPCQSAPGLGQKSQQHSTTSLGNRGRRLNAVDKATDGLCRVIRVTYLRPDGRAAGWGLHVWGAGAVHETAWDAPMAATGCVNLGILSLISSVRVGLSLIHISEPTRPY